MDNKEKMLILPLVLLFATLTMSGCSILNDEKNKKRQSLLLWVDATRVELDYYNSRISCYCEMNKTVDIKVTGVPFSDMKPRLLGQGNVGESPDIIYISSDWIGELADRKLIKPLSKSAKLPLEDSARAIDCVSYEEKLYAVPVAYDVVTLLVNRDLVLQGPALLEDLFEPIYPKTLKTSLAEVIPLSDSEGKLNEPENIWPLIYDNKNFYYHGPFYFAFSGALPRESGDTLFDVDPLVESLFYTLFLETRRKVVPVSANHSAMMSLFCNKKAKAIISGPWDYIKAKRSGINISAVPLPELMEGKRLQSFVSVHGLALAANTVNDKAAMDFINFLSSDESQAIASKKIGIVPVSSSLCQSERVDDWVKVFRTEVDKGVIMPNIPAMVQVWRQMNWVLAKCFTDKPANREDIKTMVNKARESATTVSNLKSMNLRKRGMP